MCDSHSAQGCLEVTCRPPGFTLRKLHSRSCTQSGFDVNKCSAAPAVLQNKWPPARLLEPPPHSLGCVKRRESVEMLPVLLVVMGGGVHQACVCVCVCFNVH